MNGEDFFNAINMIDDDLVESSAVIKKRKRNSKMLFAALAACLAVFVSATVVLGSLAGGMSINDVAENADQPVAENVTGNLSDGSLSAPESAQPGDTTEIYIPETAPAVSETVQGGTGNSGEHSESKENEAQTYEDISEGYSTPPQEAVTEDNKNSSAVTEATTEKEQDYNGNSAVKSESFKAKIIEINGDSVMVEPLESPESSSSDRIVFSKAKLEEINAEKGDTVIIVYDGLIMESYPAQIRASSWSFAE